MGTSGRAAITVLLTTTWACVAASPTEDAHVESAIAPPSARKFAKFAAIIEKFFGANESRAPSYDEFAKEFREATKNDPEAKSFLEQSRKVFDAVNEKRFSSETVRRRELLARLEALANSDSLPRDVVSFANESTDEVKKVFQERDELTAAVKRALVDTTKAPVQIDAVAWKEVRQKLADAAPGEWVATGNQPKTSVAFARGISGDYAKAGGGAAESVALLMNKAGPDGRSVSTAKTQAELDKIVHDATRAYADPLAIRGSIDASRTTPGRSGPTELYLPNGYAPADVTSVAFLPPAREAAAEKFFKFAYRYREVIDKLDVAPAKGSAGEKFNDAVKDLWTSAKVDADGSIPQTEIDRLGKAIATLVYPD